VSICVASRQAAQDEFLLPTSASDGHLPAPQLPALPAALQSAVAEGAADASAVWHRFMRGPVVGNFLHDQMEWLAGEGFALQAVGAGAGAPSEGEGADGDALATHLLRRCARAGREDQAADTLAWLRAVVHQPLVPLPVSLAQLGAHDAVLPEMEFWLPAQRLSAPGIDALCRQHILPGQDRPMLPERELHGMLMGFADLVFSHAGRYWVLDYKTNYLGADGAAYTPQALADAMLEHRYDVQAALYLLALHRLLRSRLGAAYDPATQLGGALYFFMRGLDGGLQGLHTVPPSLDLLGALDQLLNDNASIPMTTPVEDRP
jgi:exodeoxyribonuclease V beta subunit